MTRKIFAAILISFFGLTLAAYPKAAAQQSTGAQTMENRPNTSPSVQTMEMKNAPLAKCNVDQSTIVSGQVLHVRVRTENVPETAKLEWSADAGQIEAEGNEAVINTSRLAPGPHEVTVRTLLNGRSVSCTVTFSVTVPPTPPLLQAENYQQVKIFYATDRKETKTGDHAEYTADEADGERVAYGYALVSIPRDHRMGEMERPSMWKLELREDPNKHVVVLDTVAEDQKTFLQGVQKHLADKNGKEVLIFVHGYDNTFEDAERRLGQITYDLGFGGASILYSWPSRGNPAAYAADEESVAWSTPHFKKFLEFVVHETGATTIHIIAHSMGNRALVGALKQISDEHRTLKPRLQEIVLAAPDINVSTFDQLAKALPKTANHFTIYESSNDWALFASHIYHHFIRVGDSDPHINIFNGYDAIDATNVDTGLLGHSYFGESKSILADIFSLIRGKPSPDTRFGLQHESYINQTYWAFRK
ncbi:MAG: alpha/beta hydrolase [Candidatus Sulfotelmatobacter sp.]